MNGYSLLVSNGTGCVNPAADNGSTPFHNDRLRHRIRSEVKIECHNSSHISANARQAVADSCLFSQHAATSERHYVQEQWELDATRKVPCHCDCNADCRTGSSGICRIWAFHIHRDSPTVRTVSLPSSGRSCLIS
jgi:hypothetical protein